MSLNVMSSKAVLTTKAAGGKRRNVFGSPLSTAIKYKCIDMTPLLFFYSTTVLCSLESKRKNTAPVRTVKRSASATRSNYKFSSCQTLLQMACKPVESCKLQQSHEQIFLN
ncbi:hypothetical protein CFP56_001308 [Quercus suber]|uniref:Uncharacterized protein n=1 Tax=Quercus suber TaxID=58331 RepID=A0AAW0LFC5_QUESU